MLFGHRKHKANVKKTLSEKQLACAAAEASSSRIGGFDDDGQETKGGEEEYDDEDDDEVRRARRRACIVSGELNTGDDWGIPGSFNEIQISEPPHAG